jgi:hypothetical protein
MPYEIGDVIVWDDAFGHIGMIHNPGISVDSVKIAHATKDCGFAIHENGFWNTEENKPDVRLKENYQVFRPPWQGSAGVPPRGDLWIQQKRATLVETANKISKTAKYGRWRAFRLWAGKEEFGEDAAERLAKYQQRAAAGVEKIVKTVTCVEAIVLCFQMTFTPAESPFFIRVDAAHTMPRDLRTWLTGNWGAPIENKGPA